MVAGGRDGFGGGIAGGGGGGGVVVGACEARGSHGRGSGLPDRGCRPTRSVMTGDAAPQPLSVMTAGMHCATSPVRSDPCTWRHSRQTSVYTVQAQELAAPRASGYSVYTVQAQELAAPRASGYSVYTVQAQELAAPRASRAGGHRGGGCQTWTPARTRVALEI